MRVIVLVFVVSIMLLYGCGSRQEPSAPQPPNVSLPNVSVNKNCTDYCITLPHTACVGDWNISGVYPNCSCGYVCRTEPENRTNESLPLKPPAPQGPVFIPTNKTANQMLSDGLEKLKSEFYSNNDGAFREKAYSWMRLPVNASSDEITFDVAPASDVTFDDEAITGILASGFVVFERTEEESVDVYGLAIFKANRTILDDYAAEDTFDVFYFPPPIRKELWDCQVYSRDYNLDKQNEAVMTYFFRCEDAVDAE